MAQTRKLYRSRTDRKLAGVCGGLAQYFNTDATLSGARALTPVHEQAARAATEGGQRLTGCDLDT
jgi:hypothetical protein